MSASENSARNRIFYLAGAEFVTIYQLILNLQKIFGDVKVEHKPTRPEDFEGARGSITKAQQLLRWKPKIEFEKDPGLLATLVMQDTKHG